MVRGGILLETATKVRAADATEAGKKANCFVVETPSRNYLQSSTTPADAEGWIKALGESLCRVMLLGMDWYSSTALLETGRCRILMS